MKEKNMMREQSKLEYDYFVEKKKHSQKICCDLKSSVARVLLYLESGKKYLLMKDIPAVVSTLREVCALISAELDNKVPECQDVYYSNVPLQMARLLYSNLGIRHFRWLGC